MKLLTILCTIFATILTIGMLVQCESSENSGRPDFTLIKGAFNTLANAKTARCYWYRIADDLSQEGITQDPEAEMCSGDNCRKESERTTLLSLEDVKPNEERVSSGLLSPVTNHAIKELIISGHAREVGNPIWITTRASEHFT